MSNTALFTKKEDPLHRLSRTPTNAFRQQQWAIWKDTESMRHTPVKHDVLRARCSPMKFSSPHPSDRATKKNQRFPSTPNIISTKNSCTEQREARASSNTPQSIHAKKDPPLSMKAAGANDVIGKDICILTKVEALELFDGWDEKAAGRLSLSELNEGISSTFSNRSKKPAILPAYKAVVGIGGFVSRPDFFFFWNYLVYYNKLWSAFGNQILISRDKWTAASGDLTVAEDSTIFDQVDVHGGGVVLFGDLCEHMTRKSMAEESSAQAMNVSSHLSTECACNDVILDEDLSETLNRSVISEMSLLMDF